MEDVKQWWKSKTIWSAAVAAIAGIASLLGHTLDADTQSKLASELYAGADAIAAIAGVAAMFFRKNATVTIAPVLPPKANP